MSERQSRRRFLADILFAGGALTAASVLGYTATHPKQEPLQPEGAMVAPSPAAGPSPAAPPLTPPGSVMPVPPNGPRGCKS